MGNPQTALAVFQDPGGTPRLQLTSRGDGTADLVDSDPAGTITTVP